MIRLEPGAPGRARVSGALTGSSVQLLLDAVASGVTVFDLSDVDRVDEPGVRVLARLASRRCVLVSCPRWLDLWLERLRAK